jgi:NADH:ubiquinone oxidoreductase subunit 6 (subunit J)
MMRFEDIVIIVFGVAAVVGAMLLLIQRDPVRAALGLLLSLASVGMMFIAMGAHFVGFVQLMIYAGAIIILFLFAVMHFPLTRLRRDRIPITRLIGWILIGLLAVILFTDLSLLSRLGVFSLPLAPRRFDDALNIGRRFMSDWIYPFELVGVLLLIAVVAAMHITRAGKPDGDEEGEEK